MVQPLMRPEDIDPDAPDEGNLFNMFAKFSLSLDRLTAKIDKMNRLEQARLSVLPNPIAKSQMALLAGGGATFLDFDGPQPGRKWVVRLLIAQPSVIIASGPPVVTWYVGQIIPGPATGQMPATMARWQFAAVPAYQNFTADVIQVQPGERLIAGITAAPALTALAVTAVFNDQPLNAVMPVTIE